MYNKTGRVILSLSIPLSILIVVASCIGLFTPGFYAKETTNWQVQSVGQDMIVPSLIITAVFAYRKTYIAILLWAGVTLYVLYTFTIYSFSVHFNRLFIIYCSTLGLSFYSFAWFIYFQVKNLCISRIKKTNPSKVTGFYFFFLSLAFYLLWLSEIV